MRSTYSTCRLETLGLLRNGLASLGRQRATALGFLNCIDPTDLVSTCNYHVVSCTCTLSCPFLLLPILIHFPTFPFPPPLPCLSPPPLIWKVSILGDKWWKCSSHQYRCNWRGKPIDRPHYPIIGIPIRKHQCIHTGLGRLSLLLPEWVNNDIFQQFGRRKPTDNRPIHYQPTTIIGHICWADHCLFSLCATVHFVFTGFNNYTRYSTSC